MTEPITVAEGFCFLEAPRWREGRLWFSDFYTHRGPVHPRGRHRPARGGYVPEQPSGLGWLPTDDC